MKQKLNLIIPLLQEKFQEIFLKMNLEREQYLIMEAWNKNIKGLKEIQIGRYD